MNKNLFFMGMAATMLMASCSTDDLGGNETGKQPLASDEPIQLALSQTASTVTRAPLGNRDQDGNYDWSFDADDLGVYCLATGKIAGVEEISWKADTDNPNFLWFENRKASATASDKYVTGDDGVKKRLTNLAWVDNKTEDNQYSYYYPLGGQYSYNFYGYHPYSADVQHTDNTYKVDFNNLDGTVDVIWGRSKVDAADADRGLAYSAKYFRTKQDKDGIDYDKSKYLPNINFRHKMMKFTIILTKGTGDVTEIEKIGIKKVTLLDVTKKGTLTIATLGDNSTEGVSGEFTPDWSQQYWTSYDLKGDDDNELGNENFLGTHEEEDGEDTKTVVNDEKVIGQGFIVPVLPKNDNGQYVDNGYDQLKNQGIFRLRVEYNKQGETQDYKAAQYEIKPPVEGWQEGYEYNIRISVSSPLEVEATATLTPWDKKDIELD